MIQSTTFDEFSKAVRTAMKNALDDTFAFTESLTERIAAEYLFTVHVARKLNELNTGFGYPYTIRIECPTMKFATACLPFSGSISTAKFIGKKTIYRNFVNTSRNGKIDVAVFSECNGVENALCAIELKSFNPSRIEVKKDLVRNAEYFSLKGNTGASDLPVAIFAAMHSREVKFGEDDNIRKIEKWYENCLSNVSINPGFENYIEIFTLNRHAAQLSPGNGGGDFDCDDNHHYIGAIVIFRAKNILDNR